MSPSIAAAISHAVAFLIRPLLTNATTASTCPAPGKSFSTASITSAHLILTTFFAANAANTRGMSTYILTPDAAPPAIDAAVKGAALVWKDWFAALVYCMGDAKAERVLLFFGPGYAKVRIGEGRVVDLFARPTISPLRIPAKTTSTAAPTTAQLRAALLSAKLRLRAAPSQVRRAPGTVRAPSPLRYCSASASEDEEESDDESDASFTFSDSEFDSDASPISTPSTSPPLSPAKPVFSLPAASVGKYVHPRARARASGAALVAVAKPKAPVFIVAPRPRTSSLPKLKAQAAQGPTTPKKATEYLYSGGVTKVLTGRVMLGSRF